MKTFKKLYQGFWVCIFR